MQDRVNDLKEPQPRYTSYLLRLWQTESNGEPVWRASLESVRTGQRKGFADIGSLFAFLESQVGGAEAEETGREGMN
jgi:hypothetical protein